MRKHNNIYIIGVDAGYGNMKTARTIYPMGLVAMDTKPFFDGDILEYNGTWYRIGEGHKAYNPDKTADEDFYILTLASIAAELSTEQITEANVHLALGLPTTWTGRQREDYRSYMMRNPDVRFTFNDVLYSIHLTDCIVFPQGYAALVPLMDSDKRYNDFRQFTGTVMMADIGNGTMNIMRLVNGKPNDQHCWTEVLGVNQCVLTARKQMMDKYGIDMPESVIEQFLRTGIANLARELLDNLTDIVRGYVTGLFDALRIHGYDARLMKLFVMGGGGCLVKNFGKYDPSAVVFVDDLHASAKGYMKINIDELLANMPKDEDELKTVQEKHRKILTDNREKEKLRKARTHRLCEHGAILEAAFPQTIQMDSAQFSAFMQELAAGR